jgi:Raf kinase inhibitor-like YbhB/YbcL family protein
MTMPFTKQKLDVQAGSFEDGGQMPNEHSAYFDNDSPELRWSMPPLGAESIAILCEDPDSVKEPAFVHWLVANISPDFESIPPMISREETPIELHGGIQGTNDHGTIGYWGPRPPVGTGTHHYHFHVLALDQEIELMPGFDRDEFQEAIRDHVIAQGAVVGTFAAPG